MKKIVILFYCFICVTCLGQDVVFLHNGPQPYYIDTPINVTGKNINSFLVYHHVVNSVNGLAFRQPVTFESCTIDSLSLDWVDFQSLTIEKCKINRATNLSRVYASVFIRNSIFNRDIRIECGELRNFQFYGNEIRGKSRFVNLTSNSKFDSCTFFGDVDFLDSDLPSITSKNLLFKKTVNFVNSSFENCNFEMFQNIDSIKFSKCTFTGNNTFAAKDFKETLDLSNNTFLGSVNFDYCSFEKNLLLDSLVNSKDVKLSFHGITLPDTLNLSGISMLNNEVDLTNVYARSNEKRCVIFLSGTDISKIKLDYKCFRLGFSENENKDVKKITYEALLKNYNIHTESYELLDVEYHDFNLGAFKFLRWWNYYGYRKTWIFYWVIGLLCLFTATTFFIIDKLTKTVYTIKFIPHLPSLRQTFTKEKYAISLLWRRTWYSLVYTGAIFFLLTLKIENTKFKNKGGVLYLLFVHATGIICLAYLANLILQK